MIKNIIKILRLLLPVIFLSRFASAQLPAVDRVCPPSWWTGMQNPRVQLLIHGREVGNATIALQYPGVKLEKVHYVENKDYVFADLVISSAARPGKMNLRFTWKDGHSFTYGYELKAKDREDGKTRTLGVNSSDFIYLLMPDRFSNGDAGNDRIPGLLDQTLNRDSMYYRHGGDLQGIINHLDYFKRLGVTTIWLTPVLTNDEAKASYHGYAFTDHYEVDPRLGTNEKYAELVKAAHAKGLKVIYDIVLNHTGEQHWSVKDLPMKDWLNEWPKYTNTSFKESPLMDPHAAAIDKKITSDGWFTRSMPDLNQRNPYLAHYLIENAIWWAEYAGFDGFRIDTYIYCDLDFMNRWNEAILREFPKMGIFGEVWVHGVTNEAYFARNNFQVPFKSNLPGVTDFQLAFALPDALNEPFGWTGGVNKLYQALAKDFVYRDPMKNVVFFDNHDMSRIYSVLGENFDKYKSAFAWLLTTRGIPEMYYGDEILMKNFSSPDGLVREDFPGGWPGDKTDKFISSGRTPKENEAFDYVSTLARYREKSTALQTGKLMQYAPENGNYVYFRYDKNSTVMIIMNTNDTARNIPTARFSERMQGFNKARNVITGGILHDLSTLSVPGKSTLVLELMKK